MLVAQTESEELNWKQLIYSKVKNQRSLDTFYDLEEVIGEGGMTAVRLGIHKHTGKKVAVKTIDKVKYSKLPKELVALQREMYVARMALHEQCTLVLDIFKGVRDWFLVIEFCETDVLSWLIDNNYSLGENVCKEIIK